MTRAKPRFYHVPVNERRAGEPVAYLHRYRGPRQRRDTDAEVIPFPGLAPTMCDDAPTRSDALEEVAGLMSRTMDLLHGSPADRAALSHALAALGR